METFSDGVFAIVITLLILDVRLPETVRLTTDAGFWHGLRLVLPNIGAYALSFMLISLFWTAHHTLFRLIRAIDGRVIWLNFGYLLLITFIPYPTSLLSKAPQLASAVQLYAGSLLATSLFHPMLLRYFQPHLQRHADYRHQGWRRSMRVSFLAPALYLLALLLTFVSVPLSYVPIVFIPLFYVVGTWTGAMPSPVGQPPARRAAK